jgi:hypothetical protein
VGAVFFPSAIWVPSSAARSVFRAVRSPGHTAVSLKAKEIPRRCG